MTWLILIVRLGRAAPRHRGRVFAELGVAGAVAVSEGVWAIPDTDFHRTAVEACVHRATEAGGDIVILNTSPENSTSHDVLEAALAERLTAEAAVLARRCEDFQSMTAPEATTGFEAADRARTRGELRQEAHRLSRRDVIGLDPVAAVVARVEQATGSRLVSRAEASTRC